MIRVLATIVWRVTFLLLVVQRWPDLFPNVVRIANVFELWFF